MLEHFLWGYFAVMVGLILLMLPIIAVLQLINKVMDLVMAWQRRNDLT